MRMTRMKPGWWAHSVGETAISRLIGIDPLFSAQSAFNCFFQHEWWRRPGRSLLRRPVQNGWTVGLIVAGTVGLTPDTH